MAILVIIQIINVVFVKVIFVKLIKSCFINIKSLTFYLKFLSFNPFNVELHRFLHLDIILNQLILCFNSSIWLWISYDF